MNQKISIYQKGNVLTISSGDNFEDFVFTVDLNTVLAITAKPVQSNYGEKADEFVMKFHLAMQDIEVKFLPIEKLEHILTIFKDWKTQNAKNI